MIEARIQVDNVEEIKQRLGSFKEKAPTVLANAINRTTTNIKKNMAQQTAERYNIKSTDVRKTITITKATRTKLEGTAKSKASPIALSKFKVSPNRPVSYAKGKPSPRVYKVAVKKDSASKPLDANPKGFIAIMKAGHKEHKGLFQRVSQASKPIKQYFGPSVPQMIKNEDIMNYIQNDARSTLQKRIDAEISNILRKG